MEEEIAEDIRYYNINSVIQIEFLIAVRNLRFNQTGFSFTRAFMNNHNKANVICLQIGLGRLAATEILQLREIKAYAV